MSTRLKAFINGNFPMDGMDVYLILDFEGDINSPPSRRIRRIAGEDVNTTNWEDVDPMMTAEPSFRISDEEGRILMAALIRHFNGPDDATRLRQDYDSERSRVDQLIDHMASLSRGLLDRDAPSYRVQTRPEEQR